MQTFRKASLKGKQMLIVMLASCVALLLACSAFATYEVLAFRSGMEQDLSILAEIVANNTSAALDFGDPKTANETLSALRAQPHIEAACIYNAKGEVFAVYDRANDGKVFIPPANQANAVYFSNDSLHIFRPVMLDKEFLGTVYISSDLDALYSRLNRYLIIAIAVLLASAWIAFLLSSKLLRWISEPILSLVRTARAVTQEKNYSVRAVKQSEDELGVLVDAFNEMLKQIQERDADLQHSHMELENRVVERTKEVVTSLSLVQATLESTTDGILVTNGEGSVTSINEKFIEMWRLPLEVVGQKEESQMLEVVSPQLRDPLKFLARIASIYADPEKESFDLLEFKDERIYELYSKVQRIEEKSVGRVWSCRDITERKKVEETLRISEERFRLIVDGVKDYALLMLDPDGYVASWNAGAERIKGYKASEIIGKHFSCFYLPEDIETNHPQEELRIAVKEGRYVEEGWRVRKDGTRFMAEVIITAVFDTAGKLRGFAKVTRDITARKGAEVELEEMHKQLVDTSRQAGMAEVATSVLHNVGNVLNSVNVSSTLVSNQVRKSKVSNLSKVVELLNEHAADMGAFLTNDPKGKQLPGYLGQLAEHLVAEQAGILKELKLLHENIEHIKDIVVMQQSYAKVSGVVETVNITDLVEDALRLNLGGLQRHGVEVVREFEDIPTMDVEKHKILQILVNLVRNAKYACDESVRMDKSMKLRVARNNGQVEISVIDNGIGIPAENLTRIFNHGFTTRKEGHGFGLHSAVLAAMEMGGALKVYSDGTNKGATFTLELPYTPHKGPGKL